jgi:hypothetical protein
MRLFALLIVWFFLLSISVSSAHATVFINEFCPKCDPEWVELYNDSSDETVNLSGWEIQDGNTQSSDDLTLTGEILPHGFATFDHLKGWLNDSSPGDTVKFYDSKNNLIDSYTYTTTTSDKTYSRQPDGSGAFALTDPTKNTNNQTPPTSTPTPSPTESSTPTATSTPTEIPTPTLAKTIYKINKPKDSNGQLISSVKIYVDNLYTHHEDDEILGFCDGCFCDDAKSIQCGYGEHTIKLTKADYSDWSELRNFIQGASYEITPILTKISSEPTTTSTPTPQAKPDLAPPDTLSPTSTPTPSLTVTVTETATPSASPTPLDEFDILGSSDSASQIIPESKDGLLGNTPFFGVAAATVGLLSLAFWRLRKLSKPAKIKSQIWKESTSPVLPKKPKL